MWRLLGIEGVYQNQCFKLNEEHTSVGAGEKCHIRLDGDESVPQWQGEFLVQGNSCMYGDLDSTHLAVVNKTDEGGFYYLFHGDTIRIGGTLFRLEYVNEAPCTLAPFILSDPRFRKFWPDPLRRQYEKYDTLYRLHCRRQIRLWLLCLIPPTAAVLYLTLR
ncbi:MAG: FHA domain-containing protein [Armatimonadota bacterium]